MKLLKNDSITKKIIIAILVVLSFNFIFSNYANASVSEVLISPVQTFLLWLGDGALQILQITFLGSEAIIEGYDEFVKRDADEFLDDATDSINLLDWLVANGYYWYSNTGVGRFFLKAFADVQYPGPVVLVQYSIPAIVSNKIPAFDVNFFSPMKTEEGKPESTAAILHNSIQKWYAVTRTIALVALLSILVYMGIKIVLSSSLEEKAKYKSKIINWVVALVILFTLQYIMAITLYVVDLVTNSIASGITYDNTEGQDEEEKQESKLTKYGKDEGEKQGSKLTWSGEGYDSYITGIRTAAEMSDTTQENLGYTIMYVALVMLTIVFSYVYLKRTVFIAFLTMAAPLIAATYPLDKEKDGKAQAFNFWLKEYIFNIIMQPIHLLIYFVFVGSAIELAQKNVIYGLVSMGMIIPAEKLIRKMFNIEKAGNDSALGAGGFFEGALAASALNGLQKLGSGSSGKGENSSEEEENSNGIRMDDPFDDDDGYGEDDESSRLSLTDTEGLEESELSDEGQAWQDWIDDHTDNNSKGSLSFGTGMSGLNSGTSGSSSNVSKTSLPEDSNSSKSFTPKSESKKQIRGYKKFSRGANAVLRKYYKPVGRGLLSAAKIGMGTVGAGLGIAATVASGDIGNLPKFTTRGIASGVGAVTLGEAGVKGAIGAVRTAKNTAVDLSDTYRIGADNMTDKEYQEEILIPRLKKQNDKNKDVKDKYTKNFGDTELMSSSTRDELYKAGIVDEDFIIKVLKEKENNTALTDKQLTRDAILASGVKNYKDLESVEKRLIKNLEQKGFFDHLIEQMEKDGKFNDIDKKLEKKYKKIDENDNLSDYDKEIAKQELREKEEEKIINKEKAKAVESELKRIEKLSGV